MAELETERAELYARLSRFERSTSTGDASAAQDADVLQHELSKAERRWREHLLSGISGTTDYVGVNFHGTVYFFDPRDAKSSRTLFVNQSLRRDQAQLRRAVSLLERAGLLPQRDLFVDVGAHIGTTTIYALRHLGFAAAVAVEPDAENVRLLRLSALANGLEHAVTTVQAGVSDEEGVAAMDVGGVGSEYHHLAEESDTSLQRLVRTKTLDALVHGGTIDADKVSLLWMDIEGYEGRALRAASALLERAVPIVAEACPQKLKRSGMFESLVDLLSPTYTHVLDLRSSGAALQFRPLDEFVPLVAAYDGHCTDVLICRNPET